MTPTQARLAAERKARLDRMNQASLQHFDRCYDEAQKYLASLPIPKPPEPEIVPPDPQDDLTWSRPMPLKIIMIQKAVAEHFGINRAMLLRRTNRRIIAFPRQVAMFMIHELLPQNSYPQIGRFFGGRDHTTVLYAVRSIKERLTVDAALAIRVRTLRTALAHLKAGA
jgi:hypothetical protein